MAETPSAVSVRLAAAEDLLTVAEQLLALGNRLMATVDRIAPEINDPEPLVAAPLWPRIDLAEFLHERGWSRGRLFRVIDAFTREVRVAYVKHRGDMPPMRDNERGVKVLWLEGPEDRALVERVYQERMDAITAEVFGPQLP